MVDVCKNAFYSLQNAAKLVALVASLPSSGQVAQESYKIQVSQVFSPSPCMAMHGLGVKKGTEGHP